MLRTRFIINVTCNCVLINHKIQLNLFKKKKNFAFPKQLRKRQINESERWMRSLIPQMSYGL